MNGSSLNALLTAACAAALLAGCGGSQLPVGGPGGISQSRAIAMHAGRGGSWLRQGAKAKELLYVTSGTVVDVYSYPQGQLDGQLTGFADPYGDCSDPKGDVYVTDYVANVLVEYAHGGTQPIRTLSVPGSGPWSCAVDPSSGDLAVTTAGNSSGAGADVAIYRKANGTPKTYTDRAILSYAYCSYDGVGNLFVDGMPARGYGYDFELAELARRGRSLKAVTLQGGVPWMGGLQWDGQYLAVGQPIRPTIWQYAIGGRFGTATGSTPLTDAYQARQFIVAGHKAIVVNQYYYDRYIVRWDVLVYNYPAGGSATEIVESDEPVESVALSRSP
jgi:hypothetical protein